MTQPTRTSFDLPALDSVLGPALTSALRAGRPAASVVLAVLARARDQNVSPGRVRVWLRSRCADAEVRAIVTETSAWRTLTGAAKRHAAESPSEVRLRIARRAVTALLRPLPAGDAALVAVLALSMLDDPNGWDSSLITKRHAVTLGVTHTAVQARVRKLVDAGVLTLLSRGRGVPSRVRFAKLNPTHSRTLENNGVAVALVTLLSADDAPEGTGADDALAILRTILQPSIGYGPLSDAVWQYALLRALDGDAVLPQGRRVRARKALRDAGLDPDDVTLFADAAVDLSEGEPTRLRDERERERAVEAAERTASAERSRANKNRVHEKLLPGLLQRAGRIPKAPTREWLTSMRDACAPAIADPEKFELVATLRTALRVALLRAGWDTESVKRSVEMILPKGVTS